LIINGKFDSALSSWSTELYADGTGIGTESVVASYLGNSNVYKIVQAIGQKAKVTQIVNVTPNQWYTARAKVATDATSVSASKQKTYLYILDFPITRSAHDVGANCQMDGPGIWNPMEISFYARSTQVALQFISICPATATAGASMYWDDIELFQAPPAVIDTDLTYGNTAVAVTNGSFDASTAGWLYQGYAEDAITPVYVWAASQSGHSGVISINLGAGRKAKGTQGGFVWEAGKSVKLSAFVLTDAAAGNGGKYYAYIYSTDNTNAIIKRSAASIVQPGAIASNAWEEIKVGGVTSTAYGAIQFVTITGTKPAQTHYVDDITLAVDQDPIYFWDATLFE